MSEPSQPSYEELLVLLGEMRTALAAAEARITDLEAQLRQNSKNSSRPPSSDSPFAKPAPKSLRGKSGRKPGGQAGHGGSTLRQALRPDKVVRHRPKSCGGCGSGLSRAQVTGVEARQVFDIPQITVKVTEHRISTLRCVCGHDTTAAVPAGVSAPVQYGPNTTAIATYLNAGQFLSKARTAEALSELFGTPVSAGTVATMTRHSATAIRDSGVLEQIREQIADAPVAHFDETSLRVAGCLHWVHSASSGRFSLLTVHPKRGTKGMDHAGVLPAFTGIAVHDAWAPYDTYKAAGHALCNAHAVRELVAVFESAGEDEWCWAHQAHDALLDLKRLVDDAKADGKAAIEAAERDKHVSRLNSAAQIGAGIPGGGKKGAKHRALARRLRDRQHDYLRFLSDGFAVPWDNDLASHCTSWVRCAVSGFWRWSGRVAGVVFGVACGTDSFRQRAAEVGVVAAS
ncbi:MAG: IS66 family transposase [Streptosporangiaceae bacterium]